jgi:hypothetical protein
MFYKSYLQISNINYLTYLTAGRILTKEKIEHDDIFSAFNLLNYFDMRYEKLYTVEHMTSNFKKI